MSQAYTAEEMMAVAAARRLVDGTVCFVGIGLPSRAANLARATHAPNSVLIYESGTIGAKPQHLPLSIGDGELAETADAVVSVPEIFAYWLQAGRIDVGFLGAAQIDRYGNLNSTVIGEYDQPKVRLPGAGGAPEIATSCRETFVMLRHSRRTFVERLDFRTTVGQGDGKDSRTRFGFSGAGVTAVVTDLGVLEPDPETGELTLTELHPGATVDGARAATSWDLRVAGHATTGDEPTGAELAALRALKVAGEEDGETKRLREVADAALGADGHPPYDHPDYRSTELRAPRNPLLVLPDTLSERTGPAFGEGTVDELDSDLTRQHQGEPLGERIIVSGQVLDRDGRPVRHTLVEIWQANAAGRYVHVNDQHPAPLDPNFTGAGRCLTDAEGRYRFTTIKPGAYPWRNHPNAWRPAHIHFSLFGRAFTERLVTQMYFPGDPLFDFDPIFQSVRDPSARARLISAFDDETTAPEWALGYRFDIVLGRTPMEDD